MTNTTEPQPSTLFGRIQVVPTLHWYSGPELYEAILKANKRKPKRKAGR